MTSAAVAGGRRGAIAPLRALSADGRLLAQLATGGFDARVHSVFTRVVNLESTDGRLHTIAARGVDDAPSTVIVDVPDLGTAGVRPGDRAVAADGRIALGAAPIVTLDSAVAWECVLPRYPRDDAHVRSNVRHALRVLAARRAPDDRSAAHACAASAPLARRRRALRRALSERDPGVLLAAIEGLIGVGPGLTPAGDDLLVGLFAVLHLPDGPYATLRPLCAVATRDLRARTNAISAAALSAAAEGRVRESVVALLRAMLAQDRTALDAMLARVLAIGSTSGREIVTGILCGLAPPGPGAAARPH